MNVEIGPGQVGEVDPETEICELIEQAFRQDGDAPATLAGYLAANPDGS